MAMVETTAPAKGATEKVTARATSSKEGRVLQRGARSSERLSYLHELLVFLVPVVVVAEHRKGGGKRRIGPAPRDPARHVDDPHGAQWLRQPPGRAVRLAVELLALQHNI